MREPTSALPSRQPIGHPAPPVPTMMRWPPLAVGCIVVLLAHVLLLGGLRWVWGREAVVPRSVGTVSVRSLPAAATAAGGKAVLALEPTLPAVVAVVAVVATPTTTPHSRPPSPRSPRPSRPADARPSDPPRATAPPPLAAAPSTIATASIQEGSAQTPTPVALPGEAAPDSEAVPHYRTLMPPAASLRFQVRRGLVTGIGDLRWRPDGDAYQLDLDIVSGDTLLLTQTSRGGFDAAGLAPLRFTDKRLRRSTAAANFQRDTGRITFSGPSTSWPVRPGTQDRLSWLLQIAAIVAAEPTLREVGARVVMNLVGAHGDAGVWVFVCQAPGDDGPAGHLRYRREPRGPYDVAATVWLDPANGYLPSRAAWKSGASDDGFELRLQDAAPRP